MKQGIIFDMDGTLWDSAENVAVSWNAAIEKSGFVQRELTEADIKRVMGKTMDAIANELFSELPAEKRMQLLHICCEAENEYLREHGGMLYDGVKDTLKKLRERYHMYIVSNCQKGYIEAFLDFYRLWDNIEDIECYGNNLLQKGENIRLTAERNSLDGAVYVGDIQADYDASRKAGVSFIHAAYGFGTVDAKVPRIHTFKELLTTDFDAVFSRSQNTKGKEDSDDQI